MNAANDNTARKGLRGWWLSPPRPGPQRLINPWDYHHLRVFGVMRIAGGIVLAGIGVQHLVDADGPEPRYEGGRGSYLTLFLFTFSLENRGME